MDFDLNWEQKTLIEELDSLCKKEIEPLVSEYDRQKKLRDANILKGLLKKLEPFGLLSGPVPSEAGGAGLDFLTTGLVLQTLGKYYGSLAGVCLIQIAAAKMLYTSNNKALKDRYLKSVCSADKIVCTCITEPDVGSNPVFIKTNLTKEGNDYLLNGNKVWISNGSVSDMAFVIATVDPALGPKGLTAILVDREESPYQAKEIDKLGLRSFPTSELFFDNVRVPQKNLLVESGEGLKVTLTLFEMARSLMSVSAVGGSETAIKLATDYAKEREQFGKKIGSFQLIQQMLADMRTRTDASAFLAYRALWMMDQGKRCDAESAMAKAYATESAVKTASECIQILGAYGLSEEYPAERLFRDARMGTIPDGTTQIQKMIVARSMTGLNAFF